MSQNLTKPTKFLHLTLFLLVVGLLSSCGQAEPTPAADPTPLAAVGETSEPTEEPTATPEPTATDIPTEIPATATSEPATATPEPTAVPEEAEPTAAAPQISEILVSSPLPSAELIAAAENRITGSVSPAAAVEVCADITLYDYQVLFACTTADAATGAWEIVTVLHPRATGEGQLIITGGDLEINVPIDINYPENDDQILVTFNHPNKNSVVVPGKVLVFDGSVRNAVDGKIRLGVYACDVSGTLGERYAGIEVDIVDGDFFAFMIPPETITDEAVCVRSFTGVPFGSDAQSPADWQWSTHIPVVQEADLSAPIVELGNPLQVSYPSGQTVTLLGRVIGSVDNQLSAELRFTERAPLAGTVTVDNFGLFEATFDLPPTGGREGIFLQLTAQGEDGPVTVEYRLIMEP